MLDTVGPELQVVNKSKEPISLKADATVTLTPDKGQEASSEVLPINFAGLAKVQHIYVCYFTSVGQHVFYFFLFFYLIGWGAPKANFV